MLISVSKASIPHIAMRHALYLIRNKCKQQIQKCNKKLSCSTILALAAQLTSNSFWFYPIMSLINISYNNLDY